MSETSEAEGERDLPSDPPRRSIDLPAGPASYTDEGRRGEGPGSRPPIVAIHGLPGSARDFRWLAPHLGEHRRFIRLEMPGFGGTPIATAPDRSLDGRARFALDVVRALRLKRPIVIGHSMGGVVAAALAGLAPGDFAGLGLLSTPGIRRHALLRRTPFKALSWLMQRPVIGRALRPINRRVFAAMGFTRYPDHELAGTVHCVARTSTERHRENVLGLSLPTLVAYCEDDPLIETPVLRELAEVAPIGPRLVFERGGHNPQKTHAAAIARALLDWPGDRGPA